MARSKMRQEMIDSFLHVLDEGQIPWHKVWSSLPSEPPYNAVKGTGYRGVNRFWLYFTAEQKGFSDPRWCTFKQAKDQGWHIRQGEKGTRVEFWSLYDKKEKKTISDEEAQKLFAALPHEEYADRIKPVANIYTVFNGAQIEGIPALPERKLVTYDLDEEELNRRRTILTENMDVRFQEGGETSFYRPNEDCIHLPEIKRFKSEYAYLATLLHEAGHATGHESRLNRPFVGTFGTPEYAKEELRAEIASAFTAQELHLPQSESHMENHKAYIKSWIGVLRNEPDELFRAIREAEKISDYLIEEGEFTRKQSKEDVSQEPVTQKDMNPEEEKKNQPEPHMLRITIGKGLVGKPFTTANGYTHCQVKIPNADKDSKDKWATFLVDADTVHMNENGKSVYFDLPKNGETAVTEYHTSGIDENGKHQYDRKTVHVPNARLKGMLEAYKKAPVQAKKEVHHGRSR